MFCPRCGRAVNETSNFCGGCGLSRTEIEKYIVKTEAAKDSSAQPCGQTVSWENKPCEETVKAEETVKTQAAADAQNTAYTAEADNTCTTFAEKEAAQEAEQEKTYAQSQQYSYGSSTASQQNTSAYSYAEPVNTPKNENLSTVDFIWMMLISAIPVIGLVYLIYLALQNDNTNKRSYARASLIISIFTFIITFVFILGFILSGI